MTESSDLTPEQERVIDALRAVAPPVPPADLAARFHARLGTLHPAVPPSARRTARRVLIGAVFAAVFFGGGVFVEWNRHQDEARALRRELAGALDDLSAARRLVAMTNAGASGVRDHEVTRTLAAVALQDPSATVRTAAIEALAQIGDPPSIVRVATAAVGRERSPFVMDALVRATERLTASERHLILRAVLGSPDLDPAVRTLAERSLAS